jgi:hypothetical protein
MLDRSISLDFTGPAFALPSAVRDEQAPGADRVPPGIVNGGGSADEAESALFRRRVTIKASGSPLLAALNSMVVQTPGLVWVVFEEDADGPSGQPRCTLGLMTASRTLLSGVALR